MLPSDFAQTGRTRGLQALDTGLIIASVMCPPWPRLEPLGRSEPRDRTGSSSHKLKQLVTKSDGKGLENQSKSGTHFSFPGLLSEKLIASSLACKSVATLRTAQQVPAPVLPQSPALPPTASPAVLGEP